MRFHYHIIELALDRILWVGSGGYLRRRAGVELDLNSGALCLSKHLKKKLLTRQASKEDWEQVFIFSKQFQTAGNTDLMWFLGGKGGCSGFEILALLGCTNLTHFDIPANNF
jgi:hypothetical protein